MYLNALNNVISGVLLFAQEGDGGGAAPAVAPNAAAQQNPLGLLPYVIGFVVLFYLIVMRPQQREHRERQEQLSALKKNDKVLTIGGIIGTVVDFSTDGQRVTLRVDDGTRIKFTRSSIQGPYVENSESDSAKS